MPCRAPFTLISWKLRDQGPGLAWGPRHASPGNCKLAVAGAVLGVQQPPCGAQSCRGLKHEAPFLTTRPAEPSAPQHGLGCRPAGRPRATAQACLRPRLRSHVPRQHQVRFPNAGLLASSSPAEGRQGPDAGQAAAWGGGRQGSWWGEPPEPPWVSHRGGSAPGGVGARRQGWEPSAQSPLLTQHRHSEQPCMTTPGRLGPPTLANENRADLSQLAAPHPRPGEARGRLLAERLLRQDLKGGLGVDLTSCQSPLCCL